MEYIKKHSKEIEEFLADMAVHAIPVKSHEGYNWLKWSANAVGDEGTDFYYRTNLNDLYDDGGKLVREFLQFTHALLQRKGELPTLEAFKADGFKFNFVLENSIRIEYKTFVSFVSLVSHDDTCESYELFKCTKVLCLAITEILGE